MRESLKVVGALAALSLLSGHDFSYELDSKLVYDAARAVPRDGFEDARLLQTFRTFVASKCVDHRLARLIVSDNQLDLNRATNANLPPNLPNPVLARLRGISPDVAQVLCFGNAATAVVRRANAVKK